MFLLKVGLSCRDPNGKSCWPPATFLGWISSKSNRKEKVRRHDNSNPIISMLVLPVAATFCCFLRLLNCINGCFCWFAAPLWSWLHDINHHWSPAQQRSQGDSNDSILFRVLKPLSDSDDGRLGSFQRFSALKIVLSLTLNFRLFLQSLWRKWMRK